MAAFGSECSVFLSALTSHRLLFCQIFPEFVAELLGLGLYIHSVDGLLFNLLGLRTVWASLSDVDLKCEGGLNAFGNHVTIASIDVPRESTVEVHFEELNCPADDSSRPNCVVWTQLGC